MSTQPQWITAAGSLGSIPEGVFYQTPILAVAGLDDVHYTLIAGQLPAGIQLQTNGIMTGTPSNLSEIEGVPSLVTADITSKFAIRAYTTKIVDSTIVVDRLSDRTFTLTVTGANAPEFVTPSGNVGTYYDGTPANIQIEFTNPTGATTVSILAGALPPGLVINQKGLITGVIAPLVGPGDTASAGYDSSPYSEYGFDFSTRSTSKNYQFSLVAVDGKETAIGVFEIYVYSKDSMSADTTDFTADNTFITADVVPTRTPVLLTAPGSIGLSRSDNFYAFKFDAIDFDGDAEEYIIDTPPPGLNLNHITGWLYGYIPKAGATEIIYNFAVRVRKLIQPTVVSDPVDFSLTIIGDIETEVTWLTDSNLGFINNGAISNLYIEAVSVSGRKLLYQLVSGSNSRLPQGLTLQNNGTLTGAVSFNTFALDGGTTVFDKDSKNRTVTTETTFDMQCTFTVNAYAAGSQSDLISVFRTFTVTVVRAFNEPYQGLYIKAMPPQNDRNLISQLVQNQDIIPSEVVYRLGDPYYGVSSSVVYNHAYGLTPAALEDYVAALDINHYWKNLTLGEVSYAQARNSAGEVIYEAVYSLVVDNLVNNAGESVSKQVTLPYTVTYNNTEISTVYPNSLINMRNQVIDTVGQISPGLPGWMTSKQANGRVLGFVPAWVIAYVKPGQGAKVVYNIQKQFGNQLNTVDFKADRYEIDRRMTFAWDNTDQQWIPQPPAATTFDLTSSPIQWRNDLLSVIAWVNNSSNTLLWKSSNSDQTNPTIFDGGSTVFIEPANTVTTTDQYDKYLLYPRVNILG